MGKQQLRQQHTSVASGNGIGTQVEQTFTVEDNILPSAKELEAYKNIDPNIVTYILDAASKEQNNRHANINRKMEIVDKAETRKHVINVLGMVLAFLALIVLIGLSAFALYLDRPWFAGIFGFTAVVTIISLFINAGKK